jgi:O-acetyl-ADP-ribose deacetylase (regulator of RNase III)
LNLKTVRGDLISLAGGHFDVIVHGCNCFCTMGAGVAKAIKATFPEAYQADLETQKGDRTKLGSVSIATSEREGYTITIVNGYTQFNFRPTGVQVDYDAMRAVMRQVKRLFAGRRIGYPKIGAGLAGGDWSIISEIIDEELRGEDHTLVVWDPTFRTP